MRKGCRVVAGRGSSRLPPPARPVRMRGMLRIVLCLIGGAAVGLLAGFLTGRAWSGPILGSMLGLGGAFSGAFAGWLAVLMWPGRRGSEGQEADYDDAPATPDDLR
jgi:hypothetical protein